MLRSGASIATRLTVLVTIGAWLLLSNHCLLGAVVSPAQFASEEKARCKKSLLQGRSGHRREMGGCESCGTATGW